MADELQINLGLVFRECVRIAFADLTTVMSWDEDGAHLTPSEDLSPHETAAIQELTITKRIFESEMSTTTVVTTKVKLLNRVVRLEERLAQQQRVNSRRVVWLLALAPLVTLVLEALTKKLW